MEAELEDENLDYSKIILYPEEMDPEAKRELYEKIKELDIDFEYEEYR
ncbi:MAG: hypothetical protein ACOC55_03625 [Candidatus Natronoplasma sp.]